MNKTVNSTLKSLSKNRYKKLLEIFVEKSLMYPKLIDEKEMELAKESIKNFFASMEKKTKSANK